MNLKRVISILLLAAFIMPGIALAQTTEPDTALFMVDKHFTDDNPGSIDVRITCNIGTPLTQDATISEDVPAIFTVNDIQAWDQIRCEIFEVDVTTSGYSAKYYANEDGPFKGSCVYTFADGADSVEMQGRNVCDIENQPDYVEVTVDKNWDLLGAGGDAVDTYAQINVRSQGKIKDASKCSNNNDRWCVTLHFNGVDSNAQTILVRPDWNGTKVTLNEKVADSSIETTNNCSGEVWVYPGVGASCEFENTVFFEGIPTLSQYGLAIMALLMLGVGFVGFRRFV